MNRDIVISEKDLGHCVQAYMTVHIVVNLCVDVEGQLCIVQCCWVVGCLGCLLDCVPDRTISPRGVLPP